MGVKRFSSILQLGAAYTRPAPVDRRYPVDSDRKAVSIEPSDQRLQLPSEVNKWNFSAEGSSFGIGIVRWSDCENVTSPPRQSAPCFGETDRGLKPRRGTGPPLKNLSLMLVLLPNSGRIHPNFVSEFSASPNGSGTLTCAETSFFTNCSVPPNPASSVTTWKAWPSRGAIFESRLSKRKVCLRDDLIEWPPSSMTQLLTSS
mmetsp:Transcript_19269/g.74001  ORF Transcript_19269/g.74001 Transcript_19269/m.74001 type:complete len:202 (-) Transcript_19269:711-1316(-)